MFSITVILEEFSLAHWWALGDLPKSFILMDMYTGGLFNSYKKIRLNFIDLSYLFKNLYN